MPFAAKNDFRRVQRRARDGAEAVETVITDTDEAQPGGVGHHPAPFVTALTAAAARALPPSRPARVI